MKKLLMYLILVIFNFISEAQTVEELVNIGKEKITEYILKFS